MSALLEVKNLKKYFVLIGLMHLVPSCVKPISTSENCSVPP